MLVGKNIKLYFSARLTFSIRDDSLHVRLLIPSQFNTFSLIYKSTSRVDNVKSRPSDRVELENFTRLELSKLSHRNMPPGQLGSVDEILDRN